MKASLFTRIILIILAFILVIAVLIPVITKASDEEIVLGINSINIGIAEGVSMIKTGNSSAVATGENALSWNKTATFEWSDKDQAYVVRSINNVVDGSTGKNNFVPSNGFVLIVNLGNDYTKLGGTVNYTNPIANGTYNSLEKVNVGDKAYLVGIDLSENKIDISEGKYYDGSFTSNAKIYINSKPENSEIYTPDISAPSLDEVELIDSKKSVTVTEGIKLQWKPVENAEYYVVNVNNSTIVTDGAILTSNKKITDCCFEISSASLKAGNSYTVSVSACADGFRPSFNTRHTVLVASDRAKDSKFTDKTVVAFGDSITARPGWVSMLAGELGVKVINAGVGGDRTTHALQRIEKDVISLDPDVVIVMFGMNDQALQSNGTPLVSVKAYERNYRKIINMLHECGADIILMTGNNVCTDTNYYAADGVLSYGTGNLNKYYDVIRKLAAEYNLNLIDMNKMIAENKISDSIICAMGDGVHLSTEGQNLYTKWIADFLYDSYEQKEFINDKDHAEPSEEPTFETSSQEESAEISELSEPRSNEPTSQSESENPNSNNKPLIVIIISAVTVAAVLATRVIKRKK